jgi:hypothetical protein
LPGNGIGGGAEEWLGYFSWFGGMVFIWFKALKCDDEMEKSPSQAEKETKSWCKY